ncbi:F-box/kelch-repeat protein At3g23880-like [Silene latifolia]|uniref:F-box/kelch-repeat protein At3g23880-like n=1 Tax=Silene latifolia TaxID=37657 RepID=UPI003D774D22
MGDKDPHNSKKKHTIPQQSYLHDDLIIEEILTRLPVKSVLRFKWVSKQWYSTLSSSDFANAHLIKSPFSHPSAPVNTLFIMDFTSFYVFSYDDDQISGNFKDNLVKLDPGFSVEKDTLELTGSCNGLVCLTSASAQYFILWNPATRNLKKYGPHGYSKHFDKANYVYVASGFGYASSIDDYKYVGILIAYQKNKISDCIVCIFSLKENKWRKIDFGNDHISVFGQALLVNEKLYWYAYSEEVGDLLLSFDLGVERFDVIYNMDLDKSDMLGVMSGCLSIIYCESQFSDVMHILEPPAIVKSIYLPEELNLDEDSEMIGFTKTGKFFVTGPLGYKAKGFNRTLGIVDTSTRPMKYTMLLRFNKLIEISRYVPSLLSPFPIEPSE